eukprot:s1627_g8.t1
MFDHQLPIELATTWGITHPCGEEAPAPQLVQCREMMGHGTCGSGSFLSAGMDPYDARILLPSNSTAGFTAAEQCTPTVVTSSAKYRRIALASSSKPPASLLQQLQKAGYSPQEDIQQAARRCTQLEMSGFGEELLNSLGRQNIEELRKKDKAGHMDSFNIY